MASLITVETDYPDRVLQIKEITFGEETRKHLDKQLRERERKVFLEAVCALLNSGGGILCAEPRNRNYNYNEDGIGKDLEDGLKTLLDSARIEDFLETTQHEHVLLFFVRSWFSAEGRVRLCSLSTGLAERSGRSVFIMAPGAAVKFLKIQDDNIGQEAHVRKRKPRQGSDEDIYNKACEFYNLQLAQFNQILDFGESVNVEFKSFLREKNLMKRLEDTLPRYLSAFANTREGFVFIGIDDKSRKVVGCGQGLDRHELKRRVEALCDKAWARAFHTRHCVFRRAWRPEIKVFPVSAGATFGEPGFIIAIKVPQFCCAVFEEDPKCWEIQDGRVAQLGCSDWLEKVQFPNPDEYMVTKFESALNLDESPPQCKPVYSTVKTALLQERIFPVPNNATTPRQDICNQRMKEYPNVRITFTKLQNLPGILIMSKSWAVDISQPGYEESIVEALLITSGEYPTLFCVVKEETPELWKYAKETAFHLKQKLVNLGGYTKRICVIPCLLNCYTGEPIRRERADVPAYPPSYALGHMEDVKALLRSLVIVVLSFTSALRDRLGSEILNLLTEEQYEILQLYDNHKNLFIHGVPGSGKTLVAMEKIKRLKGSEQKTVLYLCENQGLKLFMGKQNICQCETRVGFLKKMMENISAFSEVKHIVVDEGQNFRIEDGDWYTKAQELVQRKDGFLWVFLDYFQKCHDYKDGLPPLKSQTPAYLSKIVRNSKKVFDEMHKLIKVIEHGSNGSMSTHLTTVCEKITYIPSLQGDFYLRRITSNMRHVMRLVENLLLTGHSPRDVTILFSTVEARSILIGMNDVEIPFPHGDIERIHDDVVVIDTIRRFSGLERDIVILVEPAAHYTQGKIEPNLLLSAYSRARIRLYIYRDAPVVF